MLDDFWYYHGTSSFSARRILKSRKINISRNIGTLGFGAYAFVEAYCSYVKFWHRIN